MVRGDGDFVGWNRSIWRVNHESSASCGYCRHVDQHSFFVIFPTCRCIPRWLRDRYAIFEKRDHFLQPGCAAWNGDGGELGYTIGAVDAKNRTRWHAGFKTVRQMVAFDEKRSRANDRDGLVERFGHRIAPEK